MKIEIRTDDVAWAARRATPGREGRVVVQVKQVEHIRFAGTPMVRFDLGTDLPADAGNRWYMAPAEWVL